jgi:hypothetical protein
MNNKPAGLGRLRQLKKSTIASCGKFTSLKAAMGQLLLQVKELKELTISSCGKLISLPAEMG